MHLDDLAIFVRENDEKRAKFETCNLRSSNKSILNKLYNLIEISFVKVISKFQFKLTKKPMDSTDKRVTFVDSLGMDLTLEHNIYSIQQLDQFTNYSKCFTTRIVPKFKLENKRIYDNLIKNKICLSSVEIYNQISIRGIILTLSNKTYDKPVSSIKMNKHINNYLKLFNLVKSNYKKVELSKLDLVYIIYSTDGWKTWKYQATLPKTCKSNNSNGNVIKSHEFFIQNIDRLTSTCLQLLVCHQINSTVYHDDNNNMGFNFEFISNI